MSGRAKMRSPPIIIFWKWMTILGIELRRNMRKLSINIRISIINITMIVIVIVRMRITRVINRDVHKSTQLEQLENIVIIIILVINIIMARATLRKIVKSNLLRVLIPIHNKLIESHDE